MVLEKVYKYSVSLSKWNGKEFHYVDFETDSIEDAYNYCKRSKKTNAVYAIDKLIEGAKTTCYKNFDYVIKPCKYKKPSKDEKYKIMQGSMFFGW